MIRTLVAGFTALVIAGLAANSSWAQTSDACLPFSVSGHPQHEFIRHIDVGEEGHSIGDARIGKRRLFDEAGEPAGYIRWFSSLLEQPTEDRSR